MVFGVSFEGYFSVAIGALEIESKHLDSQISLFVADFHPHVELGSNVQIVGTCIATQGHWQHVPDHHQLVLASPTFHDDLVVEVFGEIFD